MTKLVGLHFLNSSVLNPAIIERKIPSLEAITLKNFAGIHPQKIILFSNQNVKSILSFNPQVLDLSLAHDAFGVGIQLNTNLLKFICDKCPRLQSLSIDFRADRLYNISTSTDIGFENLLKFSTHIWNTRSLDLLPISFKSIEELNLTVKSTATNSLVEFIMKNINLKHLTLNLEPSLEVCTVNIDEILRLADLPKLEKVIIQCPFLFSVQNIIQFLSRSENLLECDITFFSTDSMFWAQSVSNTEEDGIIQQWEWTNSKFHTGTGDLEKLNLSFHRK